jgi:Ca-activated chloride channel family protein
MKISRAMVLSMLLAGSAQASSWSDLWYRRDQQGQHALQAGDSKRAAELFADPRRQAYAELQSGQYAAAAKRLEPLADADSQYNRGNALAKSGDLQGALNAYDGALKHADLESSLRRDAEHNRDLVARQLQAQKDQQRSSSGQQPPPRGKQDGERQGNESKDGSGDSGSSPPTTPSSASSPAQANGPPQATKDQNASSPEAAQQQTAGQQSNGGRQEPSPGPGARNATEQGDARKAAIGDSVQPQTEQQIALEQWLRQIPDDPGGLLRRKFMIEHLMNQQQVQP